MISSRGSIEGASRAWLWAALLMHAVLGLALLALVPLFRAPDEDGHFLYVESIVSLRALPVFTGAVPPNPGYEFHQPPLYYLLCAPLWAALGAGVQNYACRLVSLLCTLATLPLVWGAAQAFFARSSPFVRAWAPPLATLFAAVWPLHTGMGASANNDALAGLVCAALFYRVALLKHRSLQTRDALWIGVLCGLGALTKNTTLVVSAMALGALWHAGRLAEANHADEEREVPDARRLVVTALGVMLLVTGAHWARNQALYGDALALGTFGAAADAGTPGYPAFAAEGVTFFRYWRDLLLILFCSGWGLFGGSNSAVAIFKPLFTPAFSWPPGAWGVVAGGLLASTLTVSLVSLRLVARSWSSRGAGVLAGAAGKWWFMGLLLVVLAWAQFAYGHFSGGQARYLHPALLPVCVVSARAWCEIALRSPVAGRAFLALVAVLLGAVWWGNLVVWRTLV
jgi:hypothetical protein